MKKSGKDRVNELDNAFFQKAVWLISEGGTASASYLKRRLKIGYERASRIIDRMECKGLVGPFEGLKPRKKLKNQHTMEETQKEDS